MSRHCNCRVMTVAILATLVLASCFVASAASLTVLSGVLS